MQVNPRIRRVVRRGDQLPVDMRTEPKPADIAGRRHQASSATPVRVRTTDATVFEEKPRHEVCRCPTRLLGKHSPRRPIEADRV